MKRLSVSVLVVLVLGLAFSRADASVTVTANFTADNVVAAFYQDGATPVSQLISGDVTNWGVAKTSTIVLPSGPHTYQLVFQVWNEVPPAYPQYPIGYNNPAAFLADLTFSGPSAPPNCCLRRLRGFGSTWMTQPKVGRLGPLILILCRGLTSPRMATTAWGPGGPLGPTSAVMRIGSGDRTKVLVWGVQIMLTTGFL